MINHVLHLHFIGGLRPPRTLEDALRAVWHACLQQHHVMSVYLVHEYLGCATSSLLGALT